MADSRYILMQKNTLVADLQLDTATGVIWSVGQVYNALHIPLGIPADAVTYGPRECYAVNRLAILNSIGAFLIAAKQDSKICGNLKTYCLEF